MNVIRLEPQLDPALTALSEIGEDLTIPKNVRGKVIGIIELLNHESEVPIRINRALDQLEDIANDVNIQPYTRTQVWNVISILENLGVNIL